MNSDTAAMLARVTRAGFTNQDAEDLRRISMTLHRWAELECGDGIGCIERRESDGRPFYHHSYTGRMSSTPDRERGALARLATIMARYPDWMSYHQTDPRGAALYLIPRTSILPEEDVSALYSSRGIAVYK